MLGIGKTISLPQLSLMLDVDSFVDVLNTL